MREGTIEGGLHLHLTKLAYGEIQVLQRLGLLVQVVIMEQPGKLKPGEGKLSARTPPAYRESRSQIEYHDLGKNSFDVLKVLAILETAAHFEVGHAEITAYTHLLSGSGYFLSEGGA